MRLPQLRVAATSHPGNKRAINEDSLIASEPVFLIADGMGGHAAGDQASAAAVGAFADTVVGLPALTQLTFEKSLAFAREQVAGVTAGVEGVAGCTLSGVSLCLTPTGFAWLVVNIGDSRTYLLRDGDFVQLTKDHSLRDEMLEAGVSPDDPNLPKSNVITRALGSEDSHADFWVLPLVAGDRILVCSDGLSGELSDDEIKGWISGRDPEHAAVVLQDTVLDGPARDNLSIVVVDVLDAGDDSGIDLEEFESEMLTHFERQREILMRDSESDTLEVER